jgi:hypothetical protein
MVAAFHRSAHSRSARHTYGCRCVAEATDGLPAMGEELYPWRVEEVWGLFVWLRGLERPGRRPSWWGSTSPRRD